MKEEVIITKEVKDYLENYFYYVINNRYKYSKKYDLDLDEQEYVNKYLFNHAFDLCESKKNNFDSEKGKLKPYLAVILRSDILTQVSKLLKDNKYMSEILKPYIREERLKKLLDV